MKYGPIDPTLFTENRQHLAQEMAPHSIAVLNANDIMPTSADGMHNFIQQTDLFYLCGIDQEETILLLFPDAAEAKHRQILFVKETNPEIATWEGHKYSQKEAGQVSGIQTVFWSSEFNLIFRPLAIEAENIYINTNEHLRADTTVETRDLRFLKWCQQKFPLHRYKRLAPLMNKLRAIKNPIETDLIQQACRITGKTFERLLGFIKPNVWEYEIEAEIYHEFIKNRSRGPAYQPIIASGANACILHYIKNNQQCLDGELVLMDFGAEYANYASDLTRTVPVNGRFSDRQKAVYQAVLEVQRAAIDLLRPGNTLEAYNREVGRIMESQLIHLGLLDRKATKHQNPDKPLYKEYFMHGTSHHMGLDVHDYGNPYQPFAPGMVFTCEPGIYIKKEGLGIRIENDILITPDEPVDLMADIPVEIDEIEGLMADAIRVFH
jgi:Xaa-Pro aminopeptidase